MVSPSTNGLSADVVVVGRGATGVSTALALARQARSVILVGPATAERVPPAPGFDTRVFAISSPSAVLLRGLRVWQSLDPVRMNPVHRMRVLPSAAASARALEFDAYEAAVESLASIVEGGELTRVLEQALRFSAVRVIDGAVSALDNGSATQAGLRLADGREIQARLVVAADGAQSSVRSLAGIEARFSDYEQTAIVGSFLTQHPHRDTAYQWFGEQGILALLPLPAPPGVNPPGFRGRVSMVWSAPRGLGGLNRLRDS